MGVAALNIAKDWSASCAKDQGHAPRYKLSCSALAKPTPLAVYTQPEHLNSPPLLQ